MAETPNATAAQINDHAAQVSGRIDLALLQIKRILARDFPGAIAERNTRDGRTGNNVVRAPEFYKAGPVDITDEPLNGILMAATNDKEFLGGPALLNMFNVVIYDIDEAVRVEEQYLNHWVRSMLIAPTLKAFRGGCINPDDIVVWGSLMPTEIRWLPDDWEILGGVANNFLMTCDPSHNGWA